MTTQENSIQNEISAALRTALSALFIMVVLAFLAKYITKNNALFKGMLSGSLCGYSAFCLLIAGTKKSLLSLKGKRIPLIFMTLRLSLFATFFIITAKNPSVSFPAAVICCILTYQSFVIKTILSALLKKH